MILEQCLDLVAASCSFNVALTLLGWWSCHSTIFKTGCAFFSPL